ncbi:hypothetical protein QWT87_03235 [Chryseobacterium sp. APV1]|uniref:DUF4329 domain-containing protein n=1 Tax=Chryseobacterium urinae TaxID=3058400 RepID=A0ABT8TYL8_9FLAO|nr:hypothetical protein [Chryseobacterium sp. APV1]MDO3423889.1 hypothetical protein [Chryseobacterium sp. APV1]
MNDYVQDQNSLKISNSSKFRIITLKDIPDVSNYIQKKTGRKDLRINIPNHNTAKSFKFLNLQLTDIAEKTQGNTTYYIFGIDVPNTDNKTVYNLEVKKVDNNIETANIIIYHSLQPLSDNPRIRFDYFTGTITSINLEGKTGSEVTYNDGIGDCSPDGGTPSGNGDVGTGVGSEDTPPPNGGWNDGGTTGTSPWSNDTTNDCTDLVLDNQGNTLGWYNHCTGSYYPNVNKNSSGGYSKLTADCNGNGSGVIVTSTHDPCQKIKENFDNTKFKEKVAALDKSEVFAYDHEMGFAAGYPPANTGVTGVQYPPMENTIGTHNVKLPNGNQYFGFMHTHNNETANGNPIKIFSPADLATFLTSCVHNAQSHGSIADAYAMVITSEGNYMLNYTGASTPVITVSQYNGWKTWYLTEVQKLQKDDGSFDQNDLEKFFVRFLVESVKIAGLEIYHIEKTTGTASLINSDGTKTTCN